MTIHTNPPLLYSIKESCRLLSLGKTRIYELISSGQLEVTRIGRRTLVRAESLEELVSSDEESDKIPDSDNAPSEDSSTEGDS